MQKAGTAALTGRPTHVLILLVFTMLLLGCTGANPGLDSLRDYLENVLEKNQGNSEVGNADIYTIASLDVIRTTVEDKNSLKIAYKGEVACTTDLYLSETGRHSIRQPEWKAKRHVTKGTRFQFTGTIHYASTIMGWKVQENHVAMDSRYAPPL